MPCCHGNTTDSVGVYSVYTVTQSLLHVLGTRLYYVSTLLSGASGGTVSLDRRASERRELDSTTQNMILL